MKTTRQRIELTREQTARVIGGQGKPPKLDSPRNPKADERPKKDW